MWWANWRALFDVTLGYLSPERDSQWVDEWLCAEIRGFRLPYPNETQRDETVHLIDTRRGSGPEMHDAFAV